MFEWFYTRNKEQFGPVNSTQLKELAARGELLPSDLVWKDGMSEWVSAATLKSIFAGAGAPVASHGAPTPVAHAEHAPVAKTAAAAAIAPAPGAIPYYSPMIDMTAHAIASLRGFPALTGARGEFPLSEEQLKQVALTAKLRAPVRRAAALYLVLFVSGLLFSAAYLTFFLLVSSRYGAAMGGMPPELAGEIVMWLGIVAGLSVLSLFASRATYRCQIWAPITMIVQFSGWILYLIYMFVSSYRSFGGTQPEVVIFLLFSLVPPGVFLA
ncbi:MAG: hypothetical protein JWN40_963, partial [Phycisphaerales bacterium]|nr:hypothetical protein [Phycisphaerales bacterium]